MTPRSLPPASDACQNSMKKPLFALLALVLLIISCRTTPPHADGACSDTSCDASAPHRLGSFTPTFAAQSVGTQAMADANQTPTAAVYNNGTIVTTGVLTNDRTLTLPTLTDATAREWWIENTCTGAQGLIIACAAGTTVHIPNLYGIKVLVDSRGVTAHGVPLLIGSGQDSIQQGLGSLASGPLAIAIGKLTTASSAGGVSIGESNVASGGGNSVAIGFNNTASGTYSTAIGQGCTASGDDSTAFGVNTNAARTGELSHNSGHSNVQGMHAIDLYRQIVATTANLWDANGVAFTLDPTGFTSMNVRLLAAATTGGVKHGAEVHELVIAQPTGPNATILSDTCISGCGTIAAQGWTVTISCPGGTNELRFACNSGADTVRFIARLTWTQIGNL